MCSNPWVLAGQTPVNNLFSISSINSSEISFELVEAQNVSLKIYDVTGRLVKTIANGKMPEGYHQFEWNKTDEAGNAIKSGVYILQLIAGSYSDTKKLSII